MQAVERPILTSPYVEPVEHWVYGETGEAPARAPGRRPASYFFMSRATSAGQVGMFAEPERDELPLVNLVRADVKRWREAGYPGAETVTRQLLRHWASADLPRRLFFCQLEAAETIVYLTEILRAGRTTRWKPQVTSDDFTRLMRGERPSFAEAGASWFQRLIDPPVDGGEPLVRFGAKMATGSGKTVVMAMLIAWTFCNRGRRPADARFPNAVLVVCPNLTVKERLQVLRPEHHENYYDGFELVPAALRTELRKGRVLVENWHRFLPESPHAEGGRTYTVMNKGEEGAEAFGRRVLADLYDRGPIMVLNDEAHHAYRPAAVADDESLDRETEEEREEATVWVEGLDRIHAGAGIAFCVDLSATPFYISGSGHVEGSPFPWLVSDFGLVDAIESGIVKIPRLPVAESSGRPEPRYFALWRQIVDDLSRGERLPGGKPKPDVVWREAQDALLTLAGQWIERFEQFSASAAPGIDRTPPVLIIVCDNTDIAEVFFRKISGEQIVEIDDDTDDEEDEGDEDRPRRRPRKKKTRIVHGDGAVFSEYFANTPEHPLRTIRIDSRLLAEAESRIEATSRTDAAELLREIVATVGRTGQPGAQVRCVVSVQMLSEGWDANNVTHILGLRAFGSQLLCEQVVGRGLRRMDYVPDPETGLLTEEYVDIYGVPFSLIPFRGRTPKGPPPDDRPRYHVHAVPEREHFRIRFPVVEGYAFALRSGSITADIAATEPLVLDPVETPQAVFVMPQVGVRPGLPSLAGGFETELQDRAAYYESTHVQTIAFEIARDVVRRLLDGAASGRNGRASAHVLFPQVFRFVEEYIATRVDLRGADPREIGLDRYSGQIAERVFSAIEVDASTGEPPLLPLLNRHRPVADTSVVDFKTVKPCYPTRKSHINHVAADTGAWEQAAAFALEASDHVVAYARNDHLEFTIPYEFLGVPHSYVPDFLVRLSNETTLVLEIKGEESNEDRAKHEAARRWVTAVNNWGKLGRWRFHVCRDPYALGPELNTLLTASPAGAAVR
ncbi:MAG: DEAD/DEAH box helicase family protein [Gemmatimonadetes bacterium]|nr:DEAD/DEAH box helicase family protein [Gemmatimonadota bacterium]